TAANKRAVSPSEFSSSKSSYVIKSTRFFTKFSTLMLHLNNCFSGYLSKMAFAAFQSHRIDASYRGTPILSVEVEAA
ncbi:hypothetical protein M8C21_032188, partial [Ambrosia artemisiifolia]